MLKMKKETIPDIIKYFDKSKIFNDKENHIRIGAYFG